ncbi:MAG: peptidoglycan-binding domain-containing protein [Candidatus Omnitrophica bacterium]|nr:peptidoglycan-binding domain-containing protein [Candidatus Omnitrophota bacterium]MDD5690803.1 peptidoglycan-binding domain-containing protein [Candidatus Omnitrophota bacterium]
MKRFLSFMLVALMFATLSGCAKKQEAEDLQQITLESLGAPSGTVQSTPQDINLPAVAAPAVVPAKELMPLPPQGPYKPTDVEIQTALKNAGFYSGNIDGKIGPKSKKAIEDFQSANGLKVDGKVGAKTWEVLGRYLSVALNSDKR